MSKHHGDFYCLNCIHSFTTENKRVSHKKVCENKDFSYVAMPSNVFKNFPDMCLEICELDPVYFLSTPRLSWQASLKKAKVK